MIRHSLLLNHRLANQRLSGWWLWCRGGRGGRGGAWGCRCCGGCGSCRLQIFKSLGRRFAERALAGQFAVYAVDALSAVGTLHGAVAACFRRSKAHDNPPSFKSETKKLAAHNANVCAVASNWKDMPIRPKSKVYAWYEIIEFLLLLLKAKK